MSVNRRSLLKGLSLGSILLAKLPLVWAKNTPAKTLALNAEQQQLPWFTEGKTTLVWGYNLPVIELQQFADHEITLTNNLREPTTVHWHGMAVENRMDGVSGLTQEPVQAGDTFVYKLTPKDAGTYWAHAHHDTYRQLAMGLYVPIIVHEATPYPVDQELLFVADDWLINRQEQIDNSFDNAHNWSHGGRMGNMLTINRERNSALAVSAGSRVRLRLLNSANSRIMRFSFPGVSVHVIAKDGQPLPAPIRFDEPLIIAPAERFDLIMDIPDDWEGGYPIYERSGEQPYPAARWQVTAGKLTRSAQTDVLPLPPNPMPQEPKKADHQLTLDMAGGAMGNLRAAYYQGNRLSVNELVAQKQFWTFNGTANLPEQPFAQVKVGDVVDIELKNTTPWPHAMHLHGHHFQARHEQLGQRIWQDTVLIAARESTTIRFVATEPGKWLLHCHMIEHQVSGMVTWLEIVA